MSATNVTDKWVGFYERFFPTPSEAQAFVERCESGPDYPPIKVMMHQAQRLVSLSDEIWELRRRDALQVLFLIICAECEAKLQAGFQGDGQSKAYVKKFFARFLSADDQILMSSAFQRIGDFEPLTLEEAVDLLYDIRCDVVHEGQYWGYFFSDGDCPMVNPNHKTIARISIKALRDLVVRASICAIKTLL